LFTVALVTLLFKLDLVRQLTSMVDLLIHSLLAVTLSAKYSWIFHLTVLGPLVWLINSKLLNALSLRLLN